MSSFSDIFEQISGNPDQHVRTGTEWKCWDAAAKKLIAQSFKANVTPVDFTPFGELNFPYIEMGSISSLDLFGTDELILFAFYKANTKTYKRVVDFGANIGLHSLILARCGFDVRSFEPDPWHIEKFRQNMAANKCVVDLHEAAISYQSGTAEFTRVLGNTTGSHLSGAKDNLYGDLERFAVQIEDAKPHLEWADLAKIDIEGHEAELFENLPLSIWETTDAVAEIGTEKNAKLVYERFQGSNINLFAQKGNWGKVQHLSDLPTSHREGSVFISAKDSMPW